ncbi:MAG: conjugal transfer protein TraF [Proteobacteria bacterium]|nr:conjugal transfer protein TraF [Pseudomonadota bacterium]
MKILITLTLIFLSSNANANYRDNCSSHQLGWNFYCDKELNVNAQAKEQKPQNQIQTKKEEFEAPTLAQIAKAKTEAMEQKHQELLDIATHFPTEENIVNYISFYQEMLDKSSNFAQNAQKAIWKNPQINYSLKEPVNAIGKKVWVEQRNLQEKQAAFDLGKKYGIFFFYRSDCPYCHAYSPALRSFASKYDIEVMAISLDGGLLEEWPDSVMDQGQASKLGINAVPATIAFDKRTSEILPIGYGALSESELLQHIYLLTQNEDNL